MYACIYMYVCLYVYLYVYSGTIQMVYQGEAGIDLSDDGMSIDMEGGVASNVIEIPVINVSL